MAETKSIAVPNLPPGTLTAVEVSYRPVVQLTEEEQNAFKDLCRKVQLRDQPARREEIIRVWEKRLFDRGFQHLLPRRGGGWRLPANGTGYGPNEKDDSRSIYEANIYNPYGQVIISALTREVPTTRFEPQDPQDDADITASSNAEKLQEPLTQRAKWKSLMEDMARFLYTDGRAHAVTSYVKDGQEYGYEAPVEASIEEAAVPETEGQSDQEMEQAEEQEPTKEPRGWVRHEVVGALESKMAIKADHLCESPYFQVSKEIDQHVAKARYPQVAEKIHASNDSAGGDDIDRLARINTRLGVFENFVTSDSAAYDVTEQRTWFQPAALLEIEKDELRESILGKFPHGARVTFCGDTFCEARDIAMADQVAMVHALPGDGAHRPGLGDWLVPIQKVLNNLLELQNDYFVRGIPAKYMDSEIFDVDAIREQVNMVGSTYPFTREPGVPLEEAVWEETPAKIPAELFEFIQFLKGDLSQLLSGAVDALFGDAQDDDTGAAGMMVKRDQALGRIGLPWRRIKEFMATVSMQAVSCLARNHKDAVKAMVGGETISIEMGDIASGHIMAFPVTDENFPQTWTQKQNRMSQLLQSATQDPLTAQLLDSPSNLEEIRNCIGLEDLVIPKLASRDKQLGENVELLKSGPVPNPQVLQMQEQIEQLSASLDPQVIQLVGQMQQQIQTLPPMVSSVDIDLECDDHDTEAATCLEVINSPKGRSLRNGSEDQRAAFSNLKLHYLEHAKAAADKKSQQPQPGKPPSVSIALKDLPPREAAEAATKAGIPADARDFEAQQEADAMEKHPSQVTVQ